MGGCTFNNIGYGKTAQEAFGTLCEEARYEHGHDPYNGTISTCYGYTLTNLDQAKFTKAAIVRWIEKTIDTTEKHECHALALPKLYAKGKGRGVNAYLFVGWAAE